MEQGSFYLTLPSNASLDIFPRNQISNFTVKLAKPIDLKGPWEVALTEIQYPHSWNTFDRENAKFTIMRKSEPPLQLTFPPGFYDTIGSVVDAVNKVLTNKMLSADVRLFYDYIQRKVYFRASNVYTGFFTRDKMARVLGHVQNVYQPEPEDKTCGDIQGGFYSLFVYSDIIEHQRVGDSFAPLLRCVEVTGNNNSMVTIRYTKPDYVNVSKHYFDTLTIEIKDDQNENVAFKYGKVLVKLHFRPLRSPEY